MESLLYVCTGNLCRSPMAAALTRARLKDRPYQVTIASAGLLGSGLLPPREMVAVMGKRKLDLTQHSSWALDEALAEKPDLIIGMAREHVRAVVEQDPAFYFPRTFTLKGLVGRMEIWHPRAGTESLEAYLALLSEGRNFVDIVGMSTLDEVADPIGRGMGAFQRCAEQLEELTSTLVDYLWPGSED